MTPKEAIEILMSDEKLAEIEYYGGFEGQKKVAKLYSEAFDMAIEALEKQIEKFVDCPKGFQGMRYTRYYCPTCKALTRQREAFCHKCGQSVKYPKEVYDKENNRIVLDWSEEE